MRACLRRTVRGRERAKMRCENNTDTLQKLSDLKFDTAKFLALPEEEKRKLPQDYITLINEQRRFLVRQGTHLVELVPKLVSRFEYLLLADGSNVIDEVDQANYFYQQATRSLSPITRSRPQGSEQDDKWNFCCITHL
jgi:hypothetical protein